jgi:hypothetical protein
VSEIFEVRNFLRVPVGKDTNDIDVYSVAGIAWPLLGFEPGSRGRWAGPGNLQVPLFSSTFNFRSTLTMNFSDQID